MLVPPSKSELYQFEASAFPRPFVIFNAGCGCGVCELKSLRAGTRRQKREIPCGDMANSCVAGCFPCNRHTAGMTSTTSVSLSLCRGEMVILGTQYAGEMKKGVFTVMMYHMPLRPERHLGPAERALPLHSSCNVGPEGDVSLFFGLSGTGKTTLSADPARKLIGDDEHVWTSKGVFNIEGGCYAKCINLSREKEPEIYDAIRFGSVLENVVFDEWSRKVDYDNVSLTENTRCAYPLHYIPNALIPAKIDSHPSNVILLTCDAFGVLPPISKLTKEQVMYYRGLLFWVFLLIIIV